MENFLYIIKKLLSSIWNNKEWVFSGFGIPLIGLVWLFVKRKITNRNGDPDNKEINNKKIDSVKEIKNEKSDLGKERKSEKNDPDKKENKNEILYDFEKEKFMSKEYISKFGTELSMNASKEDRIKFKISKG